MARTTTRVPAASVAVMSPKPSMQPATVPLTRSTP